MNTNLPSGETDTSFDGLPGGPTRAPMTAPLAWPASASLTLITYAPLPSAARRYWPFAVIASLFFAPRAGIVATCRGVREPPSLFRTATESPSETNEYLPSGVTATPNGLPPRVTLSVRACPICGALAVARVGPGILSPVVTLPPPPCTAEKPPAAIPSTTITAAADRTPRDRHHGCCGAPAPGPYA